MAIAHIVLISLIAQFLNIAQSSYLPIGHFTLTQENVNRIGQSDQINYDGPQGLQIINLAIRELALQSSLWSGTYVSSCQSGTLTYSFNNPSSIAGNMDLSYAIESNNVIRVTGTGYYHFRSDVLYTYSVVDVGMQLYCNNRPHQYKSCFVLDFLGLFCRWKTDTCGQICGDRCGTCSVKSCSSGLSGFPLVNCAGQSVTCNQYVCTSAFVDNQYTTEFSAQIIVSASSSGNLKFNINVDNPPITKQIGNHNPPNVQLCTDTYRNCMNVNYGANIPSVISSTIVTRLTTAMSYMESYFLNILLSKQVTFMTKTLSMSYIFTNVTSVAGSSLTFFMSGIFQVGNQTFLPTDPCDGANLPLGYTNLSYISEGDQFHFIGGTRISSVFLKVASWYATLAQSFSENSTEPILDANFQFISSVTNPIVSVIGDGLVGLFMNAGYVQGSCTSAANPGAYKPIIQAQIYNATSSATVIKLLDVFSDVSFALQLQNTTFSAVQMQAPNLPFSEASLHNMIQQVLNLGRDRMNLALSARNISWSSITSGGIFTINGIPLSILPNPNAAVVQLNCNNNQNHGYLELTSYCDATGAADLVPVSCSKYAVFQNINVTIPVLVYPNASAVVASVPETILISAIYNPVNVSSSCSLVTSGDELSLFTSSLYFDSTCTPMLSLPGQPPLFWTFSNSTLFMACSDPRCKNCATQTIPGSQILNQCFNVNNYQIYLQANVTPSICQSQGIVNGDITMQGSYEIVYYSDVECLNVTNVLMLGSTDAKGYCTSPSIFNQGIVFNINSTSNAYEIYAGCSTACTTNLNSSLSCSAYYLSDPSIVGKCLSLNQSLSTQSFRLITSKSLSNILPLCETIPVTFFTPSVLNIIMIVSILFSIFLFLASLFIFLRRRTDSVLFKFLNSIFEFLSSSIVSIAGVFEMIEDKIVEIIESQYVSIDSSQWQKMVEEENIHCWTMIIAGCVFFVLSLSWSFFNPFAMIMQNTSSSIGLPAGINLGSTVGFFSDWNYYGLFSCLFCMCLCFFLASLPVWHRDISPDPYSKDVIKIKYSVMFTIKWLCHLRAIICCLLVLFLGCLVTVPLLLIDCKNAIQLQPNPSLIFQDAATISELSILLSAALSSFTIPLVLQFLLFFTNAIPCGALIGFIFRQELFRHIRLNEISRVHDTNQMALLILIACTLMPTFQIFIVIAICKSSNSPITWIIIWFFHAAFDFSIMPVMSWLLRSDKFSQSNNLERWGKGTIAFFLCIQVIFLVSVGSIGSRLVTSNFFFVVLNLSTTILLAVVFFSVFPHQGDDLDKTFEENKKLENSCVTNLLENCIQGLNKIPLLNFLNSFLFQTNEIKNAQEFGRRPVWRRIVYTSCVGFMIYTYYSLLQTFNQNSLRSDIIALAQTYNFDLPSGNNATVLFDPAINAYHIATGNQLQFAFISVIMLGVGGTLELLYPSKITLKLSFLLATIVFFLTIGSLLCISLPDYVSLSKVSSFLPSCAPSFDSTMVWGASTMVGLLFSALIFSKVLPIMIFFPPAIPRVLTIGILEGLFHDNNGRVLLFFVSLSTPLIISFPLALLHQFQTDFILFLISCALLIVPILLGLICMTCTFISFEWFNWVWAGIYYFMWGLLIFRLCELNAGLWTHIKSYILNAEFIIGIFLEVGLSTIVLTDAMINLIQEKDSTKISPFRFNDEQYNNLESERNLSSSSIGSTSSVTEVEMPVRVDLKIKSGDIINPREGSGKKIGRGNEYDIKELEKDSASEVRNPIANLMLPPPIPISPRNFAQPFTPRSFQQLPSPRNVEQVTFVKPPSPRTSPIPPQIPSKRSDKDLLNNKK